MAGPHVFRLNRQIRSINPNLAQLTLNNCLDMEFHEIGVLDQFWLKFDIVLVKFVQ